MQSTTHIPVPKPLIIQMLCSLNRLWFDGMDGRGGLRTECEMLKTLNHVCETKIWPIYCLHSTKSTLPFSLYLASWFHWT